VLCLISVGRAENETSKAVIERLERSLPDRLKHKEVDFLLQNTEIGVYVPEPGLQMVECGGDGLFVAGKMNAHKTANFPSNLTIRLLTPPNSSGFFV